MAAASHITIRRPGCSYRSRCVTDNKAALLITALVLPIFLSVTLLRQLVLQRLLSKDLLPYHPIPPRLSYTLYPISISLLTNYFRRYSVIRCSLWVTCVAVFLTVIVLLIDYVLSIPSAARIGFDNVRPTTYITGLLVLAFILLSVGLGGFHSNVIAFGYEQMESASAEELVTYIHLCLGLENLGLGIAFMYPAINARLEDTYAAKLALYLSLMCAAMVTVVAALVLLCQNHVVIEEPNVPNPLKLIFKVAWYSKRVHSSFNQLTFPSQGNNSPVVMPFTAREVDDVKTFFRSLPIFIPLGLFMVVNVAATRIAPVAVLTAANKSDDVSPALLVVSYGISYAIVPPFILVYHFVLARVFYSRYVTILNRMTIGVFLMMLSVTTATIMYVANARFHVAPYMVLGGLTLEQRRATIVAVRERLRIAEGHYSGQAGWHNINA